MTNIKTNYSRIADLSSTDKLIDQLYLRIKELERELEGQRKANGFLALKAQEGEPVAWVRWDDEEKYFDVRRNPPPQEAIKYLAKWNRPPWVPAFPHPTTEPRNFCPRCGNRSGDEGHIHTCTPPGVEVCMKCWDNGMTNEGRPCPIHDRG